MITANRRSLTPYYSINICDPTPITTVVETSHVVGTDHTDGFPDQKAEPGLAGLGRLLPGEGVGQIGIELEGTPARVSVRNVWIKKLN